MLRDALIIPERLGRYDGLVTALERLRSMAIAAQVARDDHRLGHAITWVKQGRVGLAFHELSRDGLMNARWARSSNCADPVRYGVVAVVQYEASRLLLSTVVSLGSGALGRTW